MDTSFPNLLREMFERPGVKITIKVYEPTVPVLGVIEEACEEEAIGE